MRIITGSAKGTKLMTLDGLNTRPTAERTKEAVFSKLQFDLEGRAVLDLFAGSGQMGLEALSRGAAHAVLCDKEREAVDIIAKNAEKTRLKDRCTILCADHAECLRRMAMMDKKFDIVFLDPPYASTLIADSLTRLCEQKLLKPGAIVVCESGSPDVDIPVGLEVVKQTKYGVAYVTILTPKQEEDQ